MDNKLYRITRRFPGFLAAALVIAVSGCASQPEQAETPPPPQQEPTPQPQPQPEPAPEPLVLKPDYPERYTVVRGDTLWDISERFLRDPWRWPELWQNNPQVVNPHLIYPGDVLALHMVDGRPTMYVERGEMGRRALSRYPTVKLNPRVREESLDRAIPAIPLDAISQFLSRPQAITAEQLEAAPYIVATTDEHLLAAAGFKVYARGLTDPEATNYSVVRPGREFKNREGEVLGYEAVYLADGTVINYGDPATIRLVRSEREVFKGDRMLVGEDRMFMQNFYPHAPEVDIEGRIIAVMNGVSRVGQFAVVVLDLGRQEGLEQGHILAVRQVGENVRDTVAGELISLPTEKAGTAMVFRVFERVSYAIIMQATRSIRRWDMVTNP